ncbi:hypothetical protein KY346_00035 [Candidatus Woesearchaeota archaeon]|nr:hypothetical protein [Candidatus Woesearchaeota archaeon]
MKKLIAILLLFLLLFPTIALAEEEDEEEEKCGLLNLASCIPKKIYEFFIGIINMPIKPLLSFIKSLISEPVSINIFKGIWSIMIYVLSMFYGLLFIYSGFNFLFSGMDVVRREMAKEWLKNTVIMIVLIQASFYLYDLFLQIVGTLTSSVLSMVNEHFFMITADNIVNIGLEFIFVPAYVLVLLITALVLVARYIVVSIGVVFIPIGIFLYFIPPLKSYGKFILHFLGLLAVIVFIDAIIILACSMLIDIALFESFKIIVMIVCFLIVDITMVLIAGMVIKTSTFETGRQGAMEAAKYIAMFAA